MNDKVNTDELAIDIHCRTTGVRDILRTHGLTIEQLADWIESARGKAKLAALAVVEKARTALHADQLETIALRGLVNVANSPKATDASRKACHDLRAIAAATDAIPVASPPTPTPTPKPMPKPGVAVPKFDPARRSLPPLPSTADIDDAIRRKCAPAG